MCIILRLYNVVQWVLDLCDGEVTQLLLGVPTCLSVHHVYRFHMDLRKAGSTRVDEPGLNLGLVLPFDMRANHCVRVAS